MTATPRTDEEVEIAKKFPATEHGLWVSAEFCRDMERGLAEANDAAARWYTAAVPYATPSALYDALRARTEERLTVEIPDSWQIVPKEPTPGMLKAAGQACDGLNLCDLDKIGRSHAKTWYRWRDMLKVAPKLASVKECILSEEAPEK